jgi:hypothetical protein
VETHTESSSGSNAVEILRAWPDASICHGFIGRSGGVSAGAFASMNLSYWVGDDDRAVDTNWKRLRREVPDLKLVARLTRCMATSFTLRLAILRRFGRPATGSSPPSPVSCWEYSQRTACHY